LITHSVFTSLTYCLAKEADNEEEEEKEEDGGEEE